MKLVVTEKTLQEKTIEAIRILCGTVKMTLGPKGNNVIIDHSTFSPFITNDGVTIAMNIESDDEVVNTILTLAKEASIKTNEIVGDGTTSTLVLLESIFMEGINLINQGVNPMIVKNELNEAVDMLISKMEKIRLETNDRSLENIAVISSGDEEIGKTIKEVYDNIGYKDAIMIKEGTGNKTLVKYYSGYSFDTEVPSIYFFQDEKNIHYENAQIIIINKYLEDINQIASILNESIKEGKPLIIIAEEYSEIFTNNILSMHFENNIPIILLKMPGYGLKKRSIIKDIEAISNAKIIDNIEDINNENIGIIKSFEVNQEKVNLYFDKNEKVKNRIEDVLLEISEEADEFLISDLNIRKSMLSVGMAEIQVGAQTITERREKKMRFDDALCAISQAKEGVVIGGGIAFLQLREYLNDCSIGSTILKKSLLSPFKQILTNAGLEYEKILDEIIESKYTKVYNLKSGSYENISVTKVMDPINVIRVSLLNAVSIASMLLTTKSIVINEYKSKLENKSNFNEM